jgi:hypothetical protein
VGFAQAIGSQLKSDSQSELGCQALMRTIALPIKGVNELTKASTTMYRTITSKGKWQRSGVRVCHYPWFAKRDAVASAVSAVCLSP